MTARVTQLDDGQCTELLGDPPTEATVGRVGERAEREFGFAHLVATEPECRQGRFTGRVAGTPCFREGKLRRVDEWLHGLGRRFADFAASACYSDSHNDLPLLEHVSRPVAVDPDELLAAVARRRGWEVISLSG